MFGECGQGKSTVLSLISKLFSQNFAENEYACNFESGKSYASVTSCVKIGTTANMTLIDTPGFNDTNVTRTDKSILNELIKIIRPMLYDRYKGITSFIQCIMPDESDRIRATSIKAMNTMLFILNSFDPRTDIENHPRIILIFNNVSLYSNDTSPEDIRQQKKQAFRTNTELKS